MWEVLKNQLFIVFTIAFVDKIVIEMRHFIILQAYSLSFIRYCIWDTLSLKFPNCLELMLHKLWSIYLTHKNKIHDFELENYQFKRTIEVIAILLNYGNNLGNNRKFLWDIKATLILEHAFGDRIETILLLSSTTMFFKLFLRLLNMLFDEIKTKYLFF